jgi:hypothetical protein
LFDAFSAGTIWLSSGADFDNMATQNGGPVIDNTGAGAVWNRYMRHPCIIKKDSTYHLFFEGRQSGPNISEDGKLGHATSSDMINWTLDANPLLDPADYSGDFNTTLMPYIAKFGDYYILAFIGYAAFDTSTAEFGGSVKYMVSTDLANWTLMGENFGIEYFWGQLGEFGDYSIQEPILWDRDGEYLLYFWNRYNGIGYASLTGGVFNDVFPAAIVTEPFTGALDTVEWAKTEQEGVTVTQSGGLLEVDCDGSQNGSVIFTCFKGATGLDPDSIVLSVLFDSDSISGPGPTKLSFGLMNDAIDTALQFNWAQGVGWKQFVTLDFGGPAQYLQNGS